MRKTAVIIITLAILGLIGVADKTQSSTHQLVSPSQTSAATSASPMPTSNTQPSASNTASSSSKYKDGTYTGNSEFTPYGTVQISMVVSGGKISDVNFLQMPSDQFSSAQRTQYSEPLLKQTTLANQSANIDFVSGATDTSMAYQQSLQSAIDQATRA